MEYPPPIYQKDGDIELRDRKDQVKRNTLGRGYHDWDPGAPHDPHHQAVPTFVAASPKRRRVNLSLWHVTALYGCCIFLATVMVALIVVMATHLNCPASSYSAGASLSLNSSLTTTATATPQGSSQFATDAATMVNVTSTISAPNMTVTSSSSRSVRIVTAPTVTVTSVTLSTAAASPTTKTHASSAK